jgi:hypothetical protein
VTLGEDGASLPAVETSGYTQAVLNMLEDLNEERKRMGDAQRALVNILEDSYRADSSSGHASGCPEHPRGPPG